jgi:hypothetical protein
MLPIRLKFHNNYRTGRPANKTQKLPYKINFIYLIAFEFFFHIKISTFTLIRILLVKNPKILMFDGFY